MPVSVEYCNVIHDTLICYCLQSDVPVDLLDIEKNSAVVSFSACDPEVCSVLLLIIILLHSTEYHVQHFLL